MLFTPWQQRDELTRPSSLAAKINQICRLHRIWNIPPPISKTERCQGPPPALISGRRSKSRTHTLICKSGHCDWSMPLRRVISPVVTERGERRFDNSFAVVQGLESHHTCANAAFTEDGETPCESRHIREHEYIFCSVVDRDFLGVEVLECLHHKVARVVFRVCDTIHPEPRVSFVTAYTACALLKS